MRAMLGAFTRYLGPKNRWRAEMIEKTIRGLRQRATSEHTCCICGYHGFFRPLGWPIRPEAECPQCHALERHRLFKLWLDAHLDEVSGKRILHFAPEQAIAGLIKPLAAKYVTADIAQPADLKINIEQIDLPDGSFDVVICSHILEHVNDRAALAEMRRILSSNGFAIIMTPVVEGWDHTYENPAITEAKERELHFGQRDHVRFFGADIRKRIRDCGFSLEEFTAVEPFVLKHGLIRGEKLFTART